METSSAVLAAGYVLSVPPLVPALYRRMWKGRDVRLFAAEELGAALVTAGWIAKGNTGGAVFNGLWTVGLGVAWVVKGRKASAPA